MQNKNYNSYIRTNNINNINNMDVEININSFKILHQKIVKVSER